jgi:glycosyltransferase involved in cell wall biosynthesis
MSFMGASVPRYRRGSDVSPRLTIITATHNAAGELPGLIESIREQTYKNLQWIVVDGASTDGTVGLLESAGDTLGAWRSEPDRGIYDAWNKGLQWADGEWLLVLGADDRLARRVVLEQAVGFLVGLPESICWAYGQVRQFGAKGQSQVLGEPWTKAKASFRSVMSLPHQGIFHRRALFDQCGRFDPGFRIAGDYALLLKAVQQGLEPVFLPMFVKHIGGGGLSSRQASASLALRENVAARRTLGLRPLYPPRWCWDYLKSQVKRAISHLAGESVLRRLVNLYRRATGRTAV